MNIYNHGLLRDPSWCPISVADLPAGTYMVTLTTKEGSATRRLLVE